DELNTDSKTIATIQYQIASLPSKTSIGMADLLPGKAARFSDRDDTLLLDGSKVGNVLERQQALQREVRDARFVNFEELESNTQEQNREIFKAQVVYILHNQIDRTGENNERDTLPAVRRAIDDLRKMVKKIQGSFNVTRVIVTADHGFLYTDPVVAKKDLQKSTGLKVLNAGPRHEITNEGRPTELTYHIPLRQVSRLQDNLFVVIPESVNRFQHAGGGYRYVHGGGSLQELIVPVLTSTRKREEVSQRVSPILVTKNLRVVSSILKVTLLQNYKVSAQYKPSSIVIGLYQDFDLVSNLEERVLESTADNPTERSFTIALTLLRTSSANLRLKVFDQEDVNHRNPTIDEPVRNDTLIQSDF
ncbi:MAG: PglZ domain-containing protein, partial [Microcystis aeruginosa Ma_MB_F_20061100_S20D]